MRRRRRSLAVLALLAAASAGLGGAAGAQEALTEGWTGRVTVYGWLTSLGGEVEARDIDASADIDVAFADILENLDFAAFANAEARRGRLGLILDVMYADLSASDTTNGPFDTRVSVDQHMLLLTGAAAWRLVETERAFVDALAGGRVVSMDIDVNAKGGGPLGVERSASGDETWFDPLIGFRAGAALTERLSTSATADIGGFGVGSELTWEVYGGLRYAVTDRISADLGYRYLAIDYEADNVDVDLRFHGPIVGATFTF